jgi:FtsH-binding integral membrane protein
MTPMVQNTYLKSALMVLAAALGALVAALSDNRLTQPEIINVVLAVLGAAVVFTAPNIPDAMYVKWALAALTAAATAVATFLGADGSIAQITASQWLQVALAVLAAIGIAGSTAVDVQRLRSADPAARYSGAPPRA